jgi:LmbE family N-acetylglucosaminyl deacetylase
MRDWGLVAPAELERVVVVSPHLDDAVLGCGRLLAAHPGATVITLYAGAPSTYPDPPTRWDQVAGFGPGDDVLAARKDEDRAALAELGATPVWGEVVLDQ